MVLYGQEKQPNTNGIEEGEMGPLMTLRRRCMRMTHRRVDRSGKVKRKEEEEREMFAFARSPGPGDLSPSIGHRELRVPEGQKFESHGQVFNFVPKIDIKWAKTWWNWPKI